MNGLHHDSEWLALASAGKITQGPNQLDIHTVLVDSRRLFSPEGIAFFALKGERHNGHFFIEDLYNRGIRCFVVSEAISLPEDACIIQVENTLVALQQISQKHRETIQKPVIAVGGSNGKTIVKEWLYQLLFPSYRVCRSPKSYNSQLGVPLSVWQLDEEDDFGLFEAGISQMGEMEKLETILEPKFGIFTNIGPAHSENFESLQDKANEKALLFSQCEKLVFCTDYPEVKSALSNIDPSALVGWSKAEGETIHIKELIQSSYHTIIKGSGIFSQQPETFEFEIPFTDKASIENAVHAYIMARIIGISHEKLKVRISKLNPLEMRLELLEGINGCSIINDVYSSDLYSLDIALDLLDRQQQHAKKTVILSDIFSSGLADNDLYQEVAQRIQSHPIDRLIGVGEKLSSFQHLFPENATFYSSTEAFLEALGADQFQQEAILLKGARHFRFEKIIKQLQEMAHETVLEIDLNALVYNLNHYRRKLKPATRIMVMVKAYGYGAGGHEIANILEYNRVDYLAVAYTDAGVALRKAGITIPIMVMNPEKTAYHTMIQHRLEPEVYSFRILNDFLEAIPKNKPKKKFPIHLKIDTGMHRLGFESNDIDALLQKIAENPSLKVATVFSHLAASDSTHFDDFTQNQIQQLELVASKIQAKIGYPILTHILNTAGLERFPSAQMDMVRLGVGLYGVGSSAAESAQLETVSTLKTVISQIKHVKSGETVGYGRAGEVLEDKLIATLPIGYADGFSRILGNGHGHVLIKGQKAPVVGNICMDMCMVDVSNINAKEGDEVIIFGHDYPVEELAKKMNTIPYEVLTSISQRVKRVYIQD